MITDDEIRFLYNEDCLSGMDYIDDCSVDLIITDPPYSSPTVHAFGRKIVKKLSDLAIQEHYFFEIKKHFTRILKPNAPVCIFCDATYSAVLMALFYDWQQTNLIVWDKGKIGMGNPFRMQHEFIFYANRGSIELNKENITHIPSIIKAPFTKVYHGAEKPLSLLRTLINGLSTEGDLVLDCFMGSGSTGVACKELRRDFVGFEIDPDYYKVALDRIGNHSAQSKLA